MPTRVSLLLFLAAFMSVVSVAAQSNPEQLQVAPPAMRKIEPPSVGATVQELEQQGDELRSNKAYLDALDYYTAALSKDSRSATILNKRGITNLQLQRYKEARKDFDQAVRVDAKFADAYNNRAVVWYEMKSYGKAVKDYKRAIIIRPDVATYYSNMGAAYFSRKDLPNAIASYAKALAIDPDVLDHSSRTGITAQLPSPEDRAHYDYELAKLYAKMGSDDRSLQHLRKAIEEGYKGIDNVYKDAEFATLRKDPRFGQLMTGKPLAIPQ